MGTIQRFEDLEVWQEGRVIKREIYRLTRKKIFSRDYAMRDQIRRASISITANIVEGFERGSNTEFIHFLSIAKGSAGEVLDLLYQALDEKYLSSTEFEAISEKIYRLMKRIGGLMKYLNSSDIKGPRYLNRKKKS